MCEKCTQIDIRIARQRQILADVDDLTAIALVEVFIAELEREKIAIHREPPK